MKPHSDLPAHVKTILAANVRPGQRLMLGLSGGMDSVVLLDILDRLRTELGYALSALHVNHQLSPHADRWAEFCAGLCQVRDILCTVAAVNVSRRPGESLEALAREARYQAFYARPADFVVLAQHLDDQAETLLLQLLRGAGVKGLSGMPLLRQRAGGGLAPPAALLRPLLEIPRSEIECYARARGLQWVEDESNTDISFQRNFLRHRLLPVLGRRFPAYRRTLGRASRNLAEAAQLLDELAQLDAARAFAQGGMKLDVLAGLSFVRAKNLLRYYLVGQGAPLPGAERLEEILRQLLHAAPDANVRIALGEIEVRRFRNEVRVLPQAAPLPPNLEWAWHGGAELELAPLEGRLSFRSAVGEGIGLNWLQACAVTVRLRCGGERLRPDCRRPARSLKHLLQEAGVPPWQRDRLPLLFRGDDLIWAAGIGAACICQAKPGEQGVVVEWHSG